MANIDPTAVTATVASTAPGAAVVSWTQPVSGAPLTYSIRVINPATGFGAIVGTYPGTMVSQTVTGLVPLESVQFIVQTNFGGSSVASAAVTVPGSYSPNSGASYSTDSSGNVTGLVSPKGGNINGLSTIRDKVRLLLQTQQAKPHSSAYWNVATSGTANNGAAPVPAWTTATAYLPGKCVSSSGNWYICLASSGTGGTNAPSGITPSIAAPYEAWDDGVSGGAYAGGTPVGNAWCYLCPATTVAYQGDTTTSIAVAFSMTSSGNVVSSGTNVSGFYQLVTGSYGSPTGWTNGSNAAATNEFVPSGGGTTAAIASWVNDLIGIPSGTAKAAYQTSGGALGLLNYGFTYNTLGNFLQGPCFEFNTDSLYFQIGSNDCTGPGVFRIFVDDVEVQPGGFFTGLATSNSSGYLLISFTGPIKIRNIKVYGLNAIRDIRITANSQLYKVKPPPLRVLAIGDSVFAGSGDGPSRAFMSWPHYFMFELGARYGCMPAWQGGTSLEGTGTSLNFINRLTNTGIVYPANAVVFSASCTPVDIVLIETSVNDSASSPTLQASYLTLLQTVRALQPNALIILHGPWIVSTSAPNNAQAIYADSVGQAAFKAWNDPNSLYIYTNLNNTEGGWLNGSGYSLAGHTSPTGNASLFCGATGQGLHPNDAGIAMLGKQTARALLQALQI